MPILILDWDSPKRELQFELDYLKSLSTQQRFKTMIKRSNEVKEMLIRYGYRKPVETIERASGKIRRDRSKRVSRSRLRARNT